MYLTYVPRISWQRPTVLLIGNQATVTTTFVVTITFEEYQVVKGLIYSALTSMFSFKTKYAWNYDWNKATMIPGFYFIYNLALREEKN